VSTNLPASPRPEWRNWLANHLGIDRAEVYDSIAKSANLRDATYWVEIVLSAGIATLGLILGSPAVIIGAMLISPLMGPIMGAGLALAAGDLFLAVRTTVNIALSCLLAIGLSILLVALLPFREMTSEIAARTQPNTLDLVVALFSGAVGAIAVSKSVRGVATSIPGVAIAVAIMPPLCVTGYGFGVLLTLDRAQGLSIVRGGGLLFLTNLVAIAFASMLVFLALHIDDAEVSAKIRRWRQENPETATLQHNLDRLLPSAMERIGSLPARLILILGMVAVVFIPLKRSFDALALEIRSRQELNVVQRRATAAWEDLFGRGPGGDARSYIDRFDAAELDGKLRLTVRVFISSSITPAEREQFLQRLARDLGRSPQSVDLSLVEIPTSKFQVARAKQETPETTDPLGKRLATIGAETSAAVSRARIPAGMSILDTSVTLGATPTLLVSYLSLTPISSDATGLVVSDIRDRLGLGEGDVRLRWVPARTALTYPPRQSAIAGEREEQLQNFTDMLRRYPQLRAVLQVREIDQTATQRSSVIVQSLASAGIQPGRVRIEEAGGNVGVDEVGMILEPRE
jgi:uncharacterized hydrophobic protein (TIGR00271 family)